eukprot:scaffold4772_cov153-Amphora_coffeaeformis.AAC.11
MTQRSDPHRVVGMNECAIVVVMKMIELLSFVVNDTVGIIHTLLLTKAVSQSKPTLSLMLIAESSIGLTIFKTRATELHTNNTCNNTRQIMTLSTSLVILVSLLLILLPKDTYGFAPYHARTRQSYDSSRLCGATGVDDDGATATTAETATHHHPEEQQDHPFPITSTSVQASLKFLGPYPCLGLRFPSLATATQRSQNVTGVSLDFVLDTASNTNTIQRQVVKALRLDAVEGQDAPPGMAAGGTMAGASTYMLGDCKVEGLMLLPRQEKEEEESILPFTFMQGLTASALPVANPAAAGLLGLPFFYCFEGGVKFQWNARQEDDNDNDDYDYDASTPSVTFYGDKDSDSEELRDRMTRITIQELPVTRLPSVQIKVNGVEMPALLDTGSPITVLNAQAAQLAGIDTMMREHVIPGKNTNTNNQNPFSKFANRVKEAQAMAQAATQGHVLSIAGQNGERVDLWKSSSSQVDVKLVSGGGGNTMDHPKNAQEEVDFGNHHSVYVGNLPGLAALQALGDEAPPAVVLGMDILRSRPTMLLCARDHEVYF